MTARLETVRDRLTGQPEFLDVSCPDHGLLRFPPGSLLEAAATRAEHDGCVARVALSEVAGLLDRRATGRVPAAKSRRLDGLKPRLSGVDLVGRPCSHCPCQPDKV